MPNSEELRIAFNVEGLESVEQGFVKAWEKAKNTAHAIDMRNSYQRVKEFHEVFGHPVADEPTVIPEERGMLRLSLILEEALELAEALGYDTRMVEYEVEHLLSLAPVNEPNLVAVADALGDLDYVVNGAALEHGINLPKVTAEIHRSNMTKLDEDGKPIYREDGKVLKGKGYEPPNLKEVM